MHRVDGYDLEFTARTSWMARVHKNGQELAEVPVAWADQMTWDRAAKAPGEFLVWLTTAKKAEEWLKMGETIIAVAQAIDPCEKPRRFKQFSRLYRVLPVSKTDDPLAVRALYVSLVTSDGF
ncbi:MAG: hypothetical protein HQL44_15270 [Alphaproteobacteria bacterium]|nr:hypothetical protein [Alphaproteobacteria bacterium]